MRYKWLSIFIVLLSLAAGFVFFLGIDIWWTVQSNQSLSAKAVKATSECTDVKWFDVLAIHNQDLDVPCGEIWLSRQTAASATGTRHLNWLRNNAQGASRIALRANLALVERGVAPVNEPTWMMPAGAFHAEAVAEGKPFSWMGPNRAGQVILEVELTQLGTVSSESISWLKWANLAFDPATKLQIAKGLADFLDYPTARLEDWQKRRDSDQPVRAFTKEEVAVYNALDCAITTPCLPLWIDLLEERSLPTNAPTSVTDAWSDWLNTVPFEQRAGHTEAVRLWVDWVRKGPDPAARLLSVPVGKANGPGFGLLDGAAPATWLALLQTSAEQIDVEMSIHPTVEGFIITAGDYTKTTTRCLQPTEPTKSTGAPLTTPEVFSLLERPIGSGSEKALALLTKITPEQKKRPPPLICP